MLSDLDKVKLQQTVDEINARHGDRTAAGLAGDITDAAMPQRLIDACVQTHGSHIHILVNLAGYCHDAMIHKCSDDQFEAQHQVHVMAPFRLIRALAPMWRDKATQQQQPKCIVNVSSVSGLHGNTGQINYSAAKAALSGLTKTVAKEWGQFGVRCNCVGQFSCSSNP